MFQTCPLSIIGSISTLYTRNRYLSCQFCWLSASMLVLLASDSMLVLLVSAGVLVVLAIC